MPAFVSALKRVDLPTLGKPTMPHFRLMGGAFGFSGRGAILGARPTLAASRPRETFGDRHTAHFPAPEGPGRRLSGAPLAAVGAAPGGGPVPVLRPLRADHRAPRRRP